MFPVLSLLLCLCLVVASPDRERRAVGIFTTGDYWNSFTRGNEELLRKYHLANRIMVKDNDVRPSSETIEWTQTSRCFWSCEEDYLMVDYYEDGKKTNPVMKVFVAKELGTPPQRFHTGSRPTASPGSSRTAFPPWRQLLAGPRRAGQLEPPWGP